ncbi:unnamed protein product [Anisakis simplex]|uniref:Proteasome subunit beta type-1 (inferred by orthology to a C. elegans protein) n=1 Tax=Anisakis simplex TaxID=6269 RepID=A0A0M3JS47_ANISI|nr:unnamed protein product [Anisakis simplex]
MSVSCKRKAVANDPTSVELTGMSRAFKMEMEDALNGSGQTMLTFKNAMNKVRTSPPWMRARHKEASQWNPYSFEGGSTAAIAGDNFAIIASDTRMSQFEVNILSRDAEKIHILSSIHLPSAPFLLLTCSRLHKYRFDYRDDMTVDLCSELLSRNLYYRRFFPYYTGAILAGKGAVFSYDPIGCIERLQYAASGSAEPMIMPFLDCQVGHVTLADDCEKAKLTIERATSLLKDAFRVSAEREICTGDKIHLIIAEHKKPIKQVYLPLRED